MIAWIVARQNEIGEPPYTAFRNKFIDLGASRPGKCACCGQPLRYAWKFADGAGRNFALGRDCYEIVDDLFVKRCREAQDQHVAWLRVRLGRILVAREERVRRQEQIKADLRRQKQEKYWIGAFGEKYLEALVQKYKTAGRLPDEE
jgi:hypothetical protein